MHQFNFVLTLGEDPNTDLPVFGFVHEGYFVFDATSSTCGRFEVDPTKAYGISLEDAQELERLNKLVESSTKAAIAAGTFEIQTAQCIVDNDMALSHFSSPHSYKPITQAMAQYLLAEYDKEQAL